MTSVTGVSIGLFVGFSNHLFFYACIKRNYNVMIEKNENVWYLPVNVLCYWGLSVHTLSIQLNDVQRNEGVRKTNVLERYCDTVTLCAGVCSIVTCLSVLKYRADIICQFASLINEFFVFFLLIPFPRARFRLPIN